MECKQGCNKFIGFSNIRFYGFVNIPVKFIPVKGSKDRIILFKFSTYDKTSTKQSLVL